MRAWVALVFVSTLAGAAHAQSGPFAPPPPRRLQLGPMTPPTATGRGVETETDLRVRFGSEAAARLLRSDDADERLRGLERLANDRSNEGLALLVRSLEAAGAARIDARGLVAAARALAPYAAQTEARTALQNIVNSPPSAQSITRATASRSGHVDEALELGRIELARGIAAMALATSADSHARDSALVIARGAGTGQPFAANAILAAPLAQATAAGAFGQMTPSLIRLLGALGDLRALDAMRTAARTGDSATRAAALLTLADMGDTRALDAARTASKDIEPQVRVAATTALLLLGAPEGAGALEGLIADDATALAGVHLAEVEPGEGAVKALAARVVVTGDLEVRRAAVAALGRARSKAAVDLLARLATDPVLAGDAAAALARSPSPAASAAVAALLRSSEGKVRRVGVRAYLVRATVRSPDVEGAREVVSRMAASGDPEDRAVAVAAEVALGRRDVASALADPDARVRRAAATAAIGTEGAWRRALLGRLGSEKDPETRLALSAGLEGGDPDGQLTTVDVLDRAGAGGPDAPLAAMALALRAGKPHEADVDLLLSSRDPLLRAHAARGLGASAAKNAVGRLAAAYAYEPDAAVRRAVILAIAGRRADAGSPEAHAALLMASGLDPDEQVRAMAARALAGRPAGPASSHVRDVAWLRLETPAGDGARATGMIVRADGIAVPIAFDDEGYALVVVPAGEARLVLAPHVPTY